MALRGFRNSWATPADNVCNAASLSADADSLLERKPVGDILGLEDDAGRLCIVSCEIGRAHPDGVRGPVLVLIGQIFLADMR